MILKHLSHFSQVMLIDYEEIYLDIFEEFKDWNTQKIQVGECKLMLITAN